MYKLPSYIPAEPHVNKFVRDSMNVTDIAGTSAKIDRFFSHRRNVNPYTEIEGSKSF